MGTIKALNKKANERSLPWNSEETLVRFNNPILKSTYIEERERCIKSDKDVNTTELINVLIPPKEWQEDGQTWIQTVSSLGSDRLDVINLQELLDTRLQQRQARESGICPIRRELFRECFDELIRQIVVISPERALLLLRVRDEARITMDAYQTLYLSSITYGQRKAVQAEAGIQELVDQVDQLTADIARLVTEYADLKRRSDQFQRISQEQKQSDDKRQAEELNSLKKANAQFKLQVDGILYQKK